MTSATESPIFVSPSETGAFAADAWPLRKDVFAGDPNNGGETLGTDTESARDETHVSESYPAGESDHEYPEETYVVESYRGEAGLEYGNEMSSGGTDLLVGAEPESTDETNELDEQGKSGDDAFGGPGAGELADEFGEGVEGFAEGWDPAGGVSQEWMPEERLDEADYGEADAAESGYAGDGVGETGLEEWAGGEVGEDREAAEVELAEAGGPAMGEAFPSGLVLTVASGPDGPDEQYWDPNSSGLPLYDTGAAVRSKKLAANFTVGELVRSGGRFDDRARISVALVQCLQAIRDRVGRPVTITSGFRSWQRNVEVYRSADIKPTLSRHCSGQAADIKIAGMTGMQIAKLAIDACGERIGVGIGADFAHIDVRGHWAVWTYFAGARDSAAKAEIEDHRRHRSTPPPQPVPPPQPTPTPTGTVRAGRLVVDRLPLLQTHAGSHPDLVLKWNDMIRPAAVDVVVHLHGYAEAGADMNIVKHKEPISGLDFADPGNPMSVGRITPTLLVLPRGNHQPRGRYGDNPERYTFPALVKPGAIQQLIDEALARFASVTGATVRRNRLILTAHSGGGAALMAILAHTDPDEVHAFDAQYENPAHLISWAQPRVAAGTGAMRVLFRPYPKTGARSAAWANARNSEKIAGAVATGGLPKFRVEQTTVDHNQIPRRFGWRLLADSSADLPGVKTVAEVESEAADEAWTPQVGDGEYWGEQDTEFADEIDELGSPEQGAEMPGFEETAVHGETKAVTVAPRFAGIFQFEQCLGGARMTTNGFDSDGNLVVDTPNDPIAVGAIQGALKDLGYPILVTSVYDDATAAIIRQFKIDQKLPVPPGMAAHDGVTGPGTSGRLNALFTPIPTPFPSPVPVPPRPALQEWAELISFRPPVPMQLGLNARFQVFGVPARVIHAIESAVGPINLDYYPVRVEALPTNGSATMTAAELLETIRRNINMFVDGSPNGCNFDPYDPAIDTPAWLPPFLSTGLPGAVISIDMFQQVAGLAVNVDDGSVVAAEISTDHWIFSTLWTPNDGGHPVSGNRRFGFEPRNAGEFIFYTRGADRTTTTVDNALAATVFGAAHRLWLSFQRRVAAFVNNNGGRAHIEDAISNRYDWGTVQASYHHPTVSWAK